MPGKMFGSFPESSSQNRRDYAAKWGKNAAGDPVEQNAEKEAGKSGGVFKNWGKSNGDWGGSGNGQEGDQAAKTPRGGDQWNKQGGATAGQ